MRYILISLVVASLVALGAGYVLLSRSDSEFPSRFPSGNGIVGTAETSSDPYDVLIKFTDEGYVPKDISIQPGQRVRFFNASEGEMWPASGVHPTHSLYPQKDEHDCLGSSFDACRELAPGEFYAFTFYYEGRWPYHDHLRAYHSGSITVTAASTSTTTQ